MGVRRPDEDSRVSRGSWKGRAPAKVNLRLRILEREASGYHRIETLFQALELADEVEIGLQRSEGIDLEVTGVAEGAIGPPEGNLAARAAEKFFEVRRGEADGGRGCAIRLHKEIPHGAGLGGGSSDAAAVLRGLNELFGHPFATDDLTVMGRELGADVPFFVHGVSRAVGLGYGDEITPVPPLPRRPVLVVVPSPGIVTGWAYGVLAAHRVLAGETGRRSGGEASVRIGVSEAEDLPGSGGREPGADWPAVAAAAENDFEPVLFRHRPDLAAARRALADAGASPALLSGSGSAVFGVFVDEETCGRAEARLRTDLPGVPLIRTHTAV